MSVVTVIPSQHRVTQQVLNHWQTFLDLKLMFPGSRRAEQLSLLINLLTFSGQHTVKTRQVLKNRGHHWGDIDLTTYLANTTGPVPLVLDLRIAHDRFRSSTDPNLNGH
jgi:hypothetical protein